MALSADAQGKEDFFTPVTSHEDIRDLAALNPEGRLTAHSHATAADSAELLSELIYDRSLVTVPGVLCHAPALL